MSRVGGTEEGLLPELLELSVDDLVEVRISIHEELHPLLDGVGQGDGCPRVAGEEDLDAGRERVRIQEHDVKPLELLVAARRVVSASEELQSLVSIEKGRFSSLRRIQMSL